MPAVQPTVEVLVPWRDEGDTHRRLAAARVDTWIRTQHPRWRRTHVDDGGELFSRGGSLDAGIRASTADVVVMWDADILVDAYAVRSAAVVAMHSDSGLVLPYAYVAHLTLEGTARVLRGAAPSSTRLEHIERRTQSVGGCTVVRRGVYLDAGGFLPCWRGWGMEDTQLDVAVETLLGAPTRWLGGRAWHLYHPPHPTAWHETPTWQANSARLARITDAAGQPDRLREVLAQLAQEATA